MAITPFTEPVQQPEFIPSRPRLPSKAIAQGVQRLQQQDTAARDALSSVEQKLAQQQVAGPNQPQFQQVMNRYREQISQIAEDDRYYNDRQKIRNLAREAQRDLSTLQSDQEARQKQLKQLEEANISAARKEELKDAILNRQSIRLTDEGRVDPRSGFSPIEIGDEADLFEVGVDAIKGLDPRDLGQNVRINEELGLIEFAETEGIRTDRIKQAILDSYRNNPEVENWRRQEAIRYRNRNPNASDEEVSNYVNRQLEIQAQRIANNRATVDTDISRRNIPEGMRDDEDGGQRSLAIKGQPRSPDQATTEAQREEIQDRKNIIQQQIFKEQFTPEEREQIAQIERQARQFEPGNPWGISLTTPVFEKRMKEAGLWDRYQQAQEAAEANASSPEYAPKYETPGEENERDYQQFEESVKGLNVNNLIQNTQDIKTIANANHWDVWPGEGATQTDYQNWMRQGLRNAEEVRMADDGRSLRIRVGTNLPENYNDLEGRVIRIPTTSLSQSQMESITRHFDDATRSRMINNWKYQDVAVTSQKPLQVNDSTRVEKTGIENFQIKRNNQPVTYDQILGSAIQTGDQENINNTIATLVPAARQQGFKNIDSVSEFKKAVEDLQKGKDTQRVQELQELRSSPVIVPDKGNAIEFAKQLN